MATGHNAMLAPVVGWDLPTLAGAGALRSSTNDMLTFLEAFLGYKESPLAPAMIGLGWLIRSTDGRKIVWHNGATTGFYAFAGFDREEHIGVVVLSNASTPSGIDDIGFHLLNPKAPLANPEPPKQRTEIRIHPTLLDHYTGRYQVAQGEFQDVLTYYPHDDLAGNAQFYLGEIAYQQKDYATAVKDYNAVLEDFSGSPKASAAQYHKGLALLQSGKRDAGIRELRALIQRRPQTPEATQARAKRSAM